MVTVYQPEPAKDFPERPMVDGRITVVPKETLQALQIVAGCASIDSTRYVLNGVWFLRDDGGILIATDGRRLAGAPARFSGREFVLPNPAVHVLAHPDFLARESAIQQPDDPGKFHIQFRSGPHTFIARSIEGNYPGYRHVIPGYLPESITIPETHRPAVIAWLRTLRGRLNSVRLTWEKPGHLTLTHWDYETAAATLHVPVTIEGQPPRMSFDPHYLADALVIGATLHLVDELNPGKTTDPSGNFCVVMNQRFNEESAAGDVETTAVPSKAA